MSRPSPLDLLLYLNSLGEVVPLNLEFDSKRVQQELMTFEGKWVPYNPLKPGFGRWGLSLTSLDGGMSGIPDLTSLKEYNEKNGTSFGEDEFRTETPALKACGELQAVLSRVAPLGRTHMLRLGRGGFFPPHRDTALLQPECFRLFASLNYTANSYSLVLNDRQRFLEPGVFHFLNTSLAHSLVSFNDFSDFVIVNLPLTVETVEKINDLLAQN